MVYVHFVTVNGGTSDGGGLVDGKVDGSPDGHPFFATSLVGLRRETSLQG